MPKKYALKWDQLRGGRCIDVDAGGCGRGGGHGGGMGSCRPAV